MTDNATHTVTDETDQTRPSTDTIDPIATTPAHDAGLLLLRVTLGGLMLFHGIAKLKGVDFIKQTLAGKGLPEFIAYGVYVGEILVPLLMIVGLFTRISSAIFAFNMLVAVWLAHSGDLLSLNKHGGWAIELPALYGFGALALVLLGPGQWALSRLVLGKTTGPLA